MKKLLTLEEDNRKLKQDLVHSSISLQHANGETEKVRTELGDKLDAVREEIGQLKAVIAQREEECGKMSEQYEGEKARNEDLGKMMHSKAEEMGAKLLAVEKEKKVMEEKIKVYTCHKLMPQYYIRGKSLWDSYDTWPTVSIYDK